MTTAGPGPGFPARRWADQGPGPRFSLLDGARLARRGDIVVVTVNFRLGVLGSLYAPDWHGADSTNPTVRDQRHALQWVREQIGAFGGDPGAITVAGQSSGAVAIAALLAGGCDLFDRAILQSGGLERVRSTAAASAVAQQLRSTGSSPAPKNPVSSRFSPRSAASTADSCRRRARSIPASMATSSASILWWSRGHAPCRRSLSSPGRRVTSGGSSTRRSMRASSPSSTCGTGRTHSPGKVMTPTRWWRRTAPTITRFVTSPARWSPTTTSPLRPSSSSGHTPSAAARCFATTAVALSAGRTGCVSRFVPALGLRQPRRCACAGR